MKGDKEFLTTEQVASVERAIGDVEKNTSAELVVVLSPRSGRYDRAEDIFGILLGLAAVALAWLLWQDLVPNSDDWATGNKPVIGLGLLLALFLLWAIIGAALATAFPVLARPFIPRGQIEAEVRRRGIEAFYLCRVGHTTARNGVLMFVSLFERTAFVAGDDAIAARLTESTWNAASRAIADGFKSGRYEAGLTEAIALCGKELASHFPRRSADEGGQLPNTVRFLV